LIILLIGISSFLGCSNNEATQNEKMITYISDSLNLETEKSHFYLILSPSTACKACVKTGLNMAHDLPDNSTIISTVSIIRFFDGSISTKVDRSRGLFSLIPTMQKSFLLKVKNDKVELIESINTRNKEEILNLIEKNND
jgi:hypothetical protein